MNDAQYNEVAALYRRQFGEPLYADKEYVGTIYDMVAVAIENDYALDIRATEFRAATIARTADVIAVIAGGRGMVAE